MVIGRIRTSTGRNPRSGGRPGRGAAGRNGASDTKRGIRRKMAVRFSRQAGRRRIVEKPATASHRLQGMSKFCSARVDENG